MELANDKELDQLLNEHFAGRVVRKDLTKLIKEGACVPPAQQSVHSAADPVLYR